MAGVVAAARTTRAVRAPRAGVVRRAAALAAAALLTAVLAGCDSLPGKPSPDDRPLVPTEVKDFAALYGANCAGCHGADGTLGAGPPLKSPVYLALADDRAIAAAITAGIPGTAMPAFAQSQGGMLTDEQVGILVSGMRQRWSDPSALAGATLPAYAAGASPGDAQRGATAYATYCASCHGDKGAGGPRGGSVIEASYLDLVSDQALRTAVIAGRPDLGMPDWRGYVPGRAMSSQEVSDVVAWLGSHR